MLEIDETRELEVKFKEAIETIYPNHSYDEELVQYDIYGSRCNGVGCVFHIQRMKNAIEYAERLKLNKSIIIEEN